MIDFANTQERLIALRSDLTAERDAAWRALYHDQFDRIYRFVCRYGIPVSDVEDVVQQTFAIAHRRIEESIEVRNVRAWLCGIAVRVASGHHRWRKVRRVKRALVEAAFDVGTPAPPTPEGSASALQAQQQVSEVLAAMKAKYRDVLVLSEIEELSASEVAEILGLPVNTVRSRRQRARAEFARLYKRFARRSQRV